MVYAEQPALRSRQMIGDGLLLLWIVGWIRAGRWVHEQVERLGTPPEKLGDAGRQIENAAQRGGDALGGLPGVGGGIEDVFGRLESGGTSLVDAGSSGEAAASHLALALGLFVAVIPIAWLVVRRVPARVRWAREATAARHIRSLAGAQDLFALRALANRPLADLRRAEGDPMAAYREGRTAGLAHIELAALGLVPAHGPDVAPT